MAKNQQCLISFCISLVILVELATQTSHALNLKAGKVNVTAYSPGLFACEAVRFETRFRTVQQIQVFATVGHGTKTPIPQNGAAIWVEAVSTSGFTVCILKFGEGSNGTTEVNWIALPFATPGTYVGTTSFSSWTTGINCETVYFPQPFLMLPTVLVTARHQSLRKPQDAMALWVEDLQENSFKICLQETKIFDGLHENIKVDWLAFTNKPENFSDVDSLVFTNTGSPSRSNNFAFCKTVNFSAPYFATPVVVVTPKHKYYSNASGSSGFNAIAAWVENTSARDTKLCLRNSDTNANSKDTITLDYAVIGDIDPCVNVTCDYYGRCKAFGPHTSRCICEDRCPSYQEPVCSSNGTTFDNKCLFQHEMCLHRYNFSLQHPGSCEGFPFQRGRHRIQNIPSLGDSNCETIQFRPFVFYPDKPIHVQITVNYIETSNKTYVHDAAVSWVENVGNERFTACVMVAGMNERKLLGNVSVDWMAYQGAPVGGVAGEVHMPQWWTGTTCKTVSLPVGKFSASPSVFVTSEHHRTGLKRDAASLWVEDIGQISFKVCLRELQNYAGAHEDIYVNWLAFSDLHEPVFSERRSVYFANTQPPPVKQNNAFCKDVKFLKAYNATPSVLVIANHSSSGQNLDPVHNGVTAWVEYINETGFRTCLKELYVTRYDPLSISFVVLADICDDPEWSYFNGYCYFTSTTCTSWLTAEANCTAFGSNLVTIHNQEENVYIQHRHNGEKSWIGLNDRSTEGLFMWTRGEMSNFSFWAPNQPNNFRDEDCVHTLGLGHGYRWNDVSCTSCHKFTCGRDYDECANTQHSCDVNAVCANTVGSYNCSCKAGFVGNGIRCAANLRLAGGTRSSGRVEIYYSGSWGTVCDDSWDINDANVVCRQLGFPNAFASPHSAAYGQGSGTIWLDNVNCGGREQRLSDCTHNGWGTHNCNHGEDASVECNT